MKITKAQRTQSHLIQRMGKAGVFGSHTLGNRERFKNFLSCLTSTPPEGCKFKVGDKVIYTNVNDIEFELVVLGFDAYPRHPDATIFVADEAYWYAVEENNLRPA